MFSIRSRSLALAATAVLIAPTLLAQESRATLTGHVGDPSKAAIPNATITLRNVATGVETKVTTTDAGDYSFPAVLPGSYVVNATAAGFKAITRENVQLHVGDKLTVDLDLPIGASDETVTVSAEAPLLDEGSATRGGLIDNAKVTELPIIGRNPINLANLVTGVSFAGNQSFQRPFDNGDAVNFSVNGGLRQANAFLIDGAPDDAYSDTAGDRSHANINVAHIPSAEVTQEFKVVSNLYDAQYGRTSGGIFNIITKNGTNALHGSGYYFFQRYQFNANNVGNKFNNLPLYSVDPLTKQFLAAPKLDQFGGQVGGPVRIPKLYNGKDKTFFLFGVEQYNEDTPSPGLVGTITALERQGDFSQSGVTIYDPYTTRLNPDGTCCTRDPFPGNKIPASRLTGAGFRLAQAFPTPTAASNVSAANYNVGANLSRDRYRTWIGRVDQNFGQNERVYVRYNHSRRDQNDQGPANYPLPLLDAQQPLQRVNDLGVVDSLTQFTSNLTMDLRASFTRYYEFVSRGGSQGYDISQLGFSQNYANDRFLPLVPKLGFDNNNNVNLPYGGGSQNSFGPNSSANQGLTGTGIGSRAPRYGISNTLGFQPSLTWLKGKHNFHFGADIRHFQYNTGGGSFVLGQGGFNFTVNQTQQNPTTGFVAGQGSSVASLIMGFPNNGVIQYTPGLSYGWWYQGYYLQDDFRLSERLTINAGIRYDIEGSPAESRNRQNRGFAFDTASPLAGAAASASAYCPACSSLKGGLLFSGTNGQSTSAFNTQFGHVQPRIGATFLAAPNLLFRGGYGLFYLPEAAFGAAQGFAQDTALIPNNVTAAGASIADTYRPRGNNPAAQPLNDPFATGILQPTGNSLGLATFQGQSIIFNNVNRKIPYTQQFSFGMQQQFPQNIKVDLSYVGSRTNDINSNDNQAGGARNLNVLNASQLATFRQAAIANGNVQATGLYAGSANVGAYLSQTRANPFAGRLPGSSLNATNLSLQQFNLPYPQFQTVSYGQESVGKIWYDSAQLSIEKRYSHGLTILGSYTWSKTQEALNFRNAYDPAPTKTIGSQDRPHRLVVSMVYELPFGRGHALLGRDNRWVELLVGGYELNLQETIQSGTPAALNTGYTLLRDPTIGITKSRLNYFNTCTQFADGTITQPNSAFTGRVACSTPAWQQINSGAQVAQSLPFYIGTIRNPNAPIGNASVSKRLKFTDTVNGQFRFEAFNYTNTYIPGGPQLNPSSNQFGTLQLSTSNVRYPNGQSNIPRTVQFGFKLNF